VGALLCAANALVTVSEQWVSSSVAAVVVASVPLWTVAFAALGGERPSRPELLGLLVGLAGVILLNAGGELSARPLGAALLVLSTWSWAGGSAWSRRRRLAPGLMAAATQMLPGGLVLVLLGLARGERILALPPARPAAAWVYLTVLGSLVGYSAYNYLLRAVRPSVATSYAYVNPAVAVALGAAAGEPVGPRAVGAMALVLAGVGILSWSAARAAATPLRSTRAS
jgi:drug/metabolite transporter (DMT)-like permease